MELIIIVGIVFVLILLFILYKFQCGLDQKMLDVDRKIGGVFENASNKAIKESMNFVQDSSFKEINRVLDPIREKLQAYEARMERMVKDEAVERTKMTETIRTVVDINLAFANEAKAFSKAMRGDIRSLGKFGEDKAEMALVASGLQEGIDFLKQESLSTEFGSIQPDFTIKLTQNRAVFVDAKMTLDCFMKYQEAEKEEHRKAYADELTKRINAHVNELSKKGYHACNEFKSMDFILMFIGSDRAISLALDVDPEIIRNALSKGILIVGPTTLMCSLKSIEFLWREERQIENLREISELGGHLYTKLVYFLQNLKDAQKAFEKSQDCLKTAMNHLNRGEKSILSDAKNLNNLGGFSQKDLPDIDD